jgi:hypothetical protein
MIVYHLSIQLYTSAYYGVVVGVYTEETIITCFIAFWLKKSFFLCIYM